MEVGTSAEIGPDDGADANSAIGVVCVLVGVACLASAFFASGCAERCDRIMGVHLVRFGLYRCNLSVRANEPNTIEERDSLSR
eukprot:6174837-Pleurochrysis_carterae.AAC.1